MDINNIEKVAELRAELDQNFRDGQALLDGGAELLIAGEPVILPEALTQSINDLVLAHYRREGQKIADQLHDLGVDTSNYGQGGSEGDAINFLEALFGAISGDPSQARPAAAPRAVGIPLTRSQLASIVGGDVDILSLLGGRRS